MLVSQAVKMCITPSAPPGTLYFHGPASDVNAPAVLWIVRTDYSVGGEGTGSLCGVCLLHVVCVCVCVYMDTCKLLCVRVSARDPNASLTSKVCFQACARIKEARIKNVLM